MDNEINEARFALKDFDRSLLDDTQKNLQGESLRSAIKHYYEKQLGFVASSTDVVVTSDEIILRWSKVGAVDSNSLQDQGIGYLQQGDYAKGISLLETAIAIEPDNSDLLYNLGMALSDVNRLDESLVHLNKCVGIAPDYARGWLALGVCYSRIGKVNETLLALRKAHAIDSTDPYTMKTLAAFLIKVGNNLDEAETLLRNAMEVMPDDQQIHFNIGKLGEKMNDLTMADEAYLKVIDLNGHSEIAEAAKEARSAISEKIFRERGMGATSDRPDAVMYCLDALEKFAVRSEDEVKKITFEIATIGMNGLDVNDPAQKYSLNSLSGKFSGLHMLAIQYVGFQRIDPSLDLGFDLSQELNAAQTLFKK